MRRFSTALVLTLGLLPLIISAETWAAGDNQKPYFQFFALFTNCQPVTLTVDLDPGRLALTEADIRNLVESRLRAAKIYTDEVRAYMPIFSVQVNVVEDAFGVQLELTKALYDKALYDSGLEFSGPAPTWSRWITGTHNYSGGGAFILSALSQLMDEFLADYLRVNQKFPCVKAKVRSQ